MNIPLTPVRCLDRAVSLYGQKEGVIFESERLTYQQFGNLCARMAATLCQAGVLPGDRVAFLSFNNTSLLAAYFVVPGIDAILMPLNVRLKANELIAILEQVRPRVLVYESEFASDVAAFQQAQLVVERYILIDELDSGEPAEPDTKPPMQQPCTEIDENAPAMLFYTSGSSGGRSKGVLLSHRSLYLHALSLAGSLDHGDSQVMLHSIPLFHANGWGFPQFATMCGMKQVIARRFDPATVLRLIQDEGATRMILVPTMGNMLLNFEHHAKFDLSSMRQIIVGGAKASLGLMEGLQRVFPLAEVISGYGLTESGPILTISRSKWSPSAQTDRQKLQRAASAGWPVLGVETRVVDSMMRDVPKDGSTVGEVIARSDHFMDAYYLDAKATESAFTDGWMRTGDMATWDEEGWLRISDRRKDIIISGGENVSSVEIEEVIALHPNVLECAVIAADDPHWGEVPVAIVLLREKEAVTGEQLINFAMQHLAHYKVPRIVHFTNAALPKTGTGKVMKYRLRELYGYGAVPGPVAL